MLSEKSKRILTVISFTLIFLIVLVTRFLYLKDALWYDEACSWFTSVQNFPFGIINNLFTIDLQHTPLYFFILHFWMMLFGDAEITLRSLSLIFSVLSCFIVYPICCKISKSKIFAFSVMSIIATSPLLSLFSVEVRMYPLAILLVLLSINLLLDFENYGNMSTLKKLTFTNILLPYTLVGGIFYNISLALCYSIYLFRNKKNKLKSYLKSLIIEFLCLIPYFAMVIYYAIERRNFIIKHEGSLYFYQIADVIRNFFAINPVSNPYWPNEAPYEMTISLFLTVLLPCIYFIYGLIKGFKTSKDFNKTIYVILFSIFGLFILSSALQINVFTVRYMSYIMIPLIIFGLYGLAKNISKTHYIIFACAFSLVSLYTNFNYAKKIQVNKENAFKAVRLETDKITLDTRDIVIMPFGSDAPYYFRTKNSPRILFFDIHKELRNPLNSRYYDNFQQKFTNKKTKYDMLYESIIQDAPFSNAHKQYFYENVINNIESGRYVLIALYMSDSDALKNFDEIKKSINNADDIKNNTTEPMLEKYLYDIRVFLKDDFNFIGQNKSQTYTYLLYEKK